MSLDNGSTFTWQRSGSVIERMEETYTAKRAVSMEDIVRAHHVLRE
ncbi:hypothetical protein [Paenibacillus uliginis]|nr:hypothetical protein [Paenibacillus uliginis]